MNITPNRIAVYLVSIAGLLAALAPAVANLDWTSTAGLIGGLAAIAAVVNKWLTGWQKDEDREYHRESLEQQNILAAPDDYDSINDGDDSTTGNQANE